MNDPPTTVGSDTGPRTSSPLAQLPPTRRSILSELKRTGERDIDQLAAELDLTPSALRRHLSVLVAEGTVVRREERAGPGRPRHLYRIGPSAEALFPKRYPELTNELLSYVEEADPSLVKTVFARRQQRRVDGAKARLGTRSFDERVTELTRILDEDGYLASVERRDDGSWLITEHNCAILGVAQQYGLACSSELAFIREALPDARVERVAHMIAGAHVCAYDVRRSATIPA